ncbi:MAG: periplasmic heavy metal sensor [Thermodesulfobacteriota bacterium]
MKKNLFVLSILVLTIGFGLSVYAKGFHNLEAFAGLSKEKQTLIVETMKKNHDAKKELWSKMKEAKSGMHDALTAPTFNADAFQASVDNMEELMSTKFEIMIDTVKELAPQLNQAEREVLAEMFPKGKHGHGYHGSDCSK